MSRGLSEGDGSASSGSDMDLDDELIRPEDPNLPRPADTESSAAPELSRSSNLEEGELEASDDDEEEDGGMDGFPGPLGPDHGNRPYRYQDQGPGDFIHPSRRSFAGGGHTSAHPGEHPLW